MAYNTPTTKSVGDTLAAADWNTYVRDNFAASAPDVFTAAGDLYVASGANAGTVLASTTKHYVLETTGTGAALQWSGLAPACRVSRSSAQSISDNTATEISFDTEDADPDGWFPGSGTTITLPSVSDGGTGLYVVHAWGYFDGHATDAKMRNIGIGIAGNVQWASFLQDADTNPTYCSITQIVALTATTALKMHVQQITGGALNFTSARMTVAKLR